MSTKNAESKKKRLQLTAKQGSWEQLGAACRQVRHKVFVEEQGIPKEEELDAEDARSEHFLLLINERPVATARLTPEGQLGRLAVLPPLRGKKMGQRLLQRIIRHAHRLGLKKIQLNAQVAGLDFYRKQGFKETGEEYLEVGIPHQPMSLPLVDEATEETCFSTEVIQKALQESQQIKIQGKEQLQQVVAVLIQEAARSFSLEAPTYPSRWFTSQALEPLMRLARRHQHSRVQCILGETLQFSRQSSNLLKLHQRAPSHIHIRKAASQQRQVHQAFLLIDDKHLLWWPHYQEARAELYTGEHREAFRQAQAFKSHWERAETVKYLQGSQL